MPIPTRVVTRYQNRNHALKYYLLPLRCLLPLPIPSSLTSILLLNRRLSYQKCLYYLPLPRLLQLFQLIKNHLPTNFVPVVIVPFANISARKRTVVVPWRLVFALIVPIDRNPAVIVPKLPDVAEPTYSAEFRVEVFVPIK